MRRHAMLLRAKMAMFTFVTWPEVAAWNASIISAFVVWVQYAHSSFASAINVELGSEIPCPETEVR